VLLEGESRFSLCAMRLVSRMTVALLSQYSES
jgi:hypothetical protein